MSEPRYPAQVALNPSSFSLCQAAPPAIWRIRYGQRIAQLASCTEVEGRLSATKQLPPPTLCCCYLGARTFAQPSYCSTFKPAFQSVTYTRPSVVTRISADLAASETFGRGSIIFLGGG